MTERLDALELEHISIKKELSSLDKLVTKILVKMDTHFNEDKRYEKTIRNIDDNLNSLLIDLAKQPMVRSREMATVAEPLWESIRKIKNDISEFETKADKEHQYLKMTVKEELRKEAKSHLILAWSLIIGIVIMIGYNVKIIDERINDNTKHLNNHHENHLYLDSVDHNGHENG